MATTDAMPPEIELEESPDGVRYRLPRRPLGRARLVGLFPVLFGLVFAGVPIGIMVGAAIFFLPAGGLPALFALGFMLFMLLLVVAGVAMFALGLFILVGRMDIEVKDGRLRAAERAGLFRWSRSRPLDRIRKFSLHSGKARINDQPVTSGPLASLAALAAECDGVKPMLVALYYPRDWLKPLADDLARRCADAGFTLAPPEELTAAVPRSAAAPIVEIVEEPVDSLSFKERLEQPGGSQVRIDTHADGVTLTVPPAGLRKGSKGLLTFSLIWLGFMVLFSSVVGVIAFNDAGIPWLFFAIMPVFWLAGVAMLLGAINMGRRQAVFAVVRDSLMVLQTGLFGGKKHEWPRDQIADVVTGPSGMSVNDVPVLDLQVRLQSGGKQGFLAGRDEAELQWMATVLRQALRVPAEGQEALSPQTQVAPNRLNP